MKRCLALLLPALAAGEAFAATRGDSVLPHRQDQPPNEPYSPAEALANMSVPAGFRVTFQDPGLLAALPNVLSSAPPPFVRRVLAALGRIEDPKLAEGVLEVYPRLEPELQPLAIDLLMHREPWARKLLDTVLTSRLPKGVLNANHLRKILESNDREALWAVEKAFGRIREERNPAREAVVAEMTVLLRGHLGDPHRGQTVFRRLCAQCHTIYGEGGKVGPDITANGRASFEQLLSNVFDPSLVIGPAYQVTTVVTQDGRNLTGLIVEDNEQRVVVRMPGEGEEAVPRNQIKYTRVSKLSMMPDGIEASLDRKDLADLFAFLALDLPPTNAAAKLIPGATELPAANVPAKPVGRFHLESGDGKLVVRSQLPGQSAGLELVTYVMATNARPYLHPVRDASGQTVLTEDRLADHPWQHGIFTGFHRVNGFNYWREDDEQGLINPNVSGLGDWSIPAPRERRFRYRLVIYRGSATREQLTDRFAQFARH